MHRHRGQAAAEIALDLERHFQQPVPLTLRRLRALLSDLAAMSETRRNNLVQITALLEAYDLGGMPLSTVAVLLSAVDRVGPGDVAAYFTPHELEDLLSQVQ